jgi:hypothetical protein
MQPDSALSPVKIEVFPPSPANASPFFSAVATLSRWGPQLSNQSTSCVTCSGNATLSWDTTLGWGGAGKSVASLS